MSENKDLLNKISELEKELNKTKQQLIESKNPYVDINKIENENKYYYDNKYGEVDYHIYLNDSVDKQLINNYNAFTDEEYAKKVSKKELLMRKLDKFAWDNNSNINREDWKNDKVVKYFIGYDYDAEYFEIDTWNYSRDLGQVYFKSLEVVSKAVEEFKEELLEYFNN